MNLRGMLLSGALAGLGLVGVEVLSRTLWQKLDSRRGLRLTHQIRRDWLADLPADRLSPMVQVPYGLYWNRPQVLDSNGVHQTNERGYRQGPRATAVPKPPGCVRILVLGGSTTFSDRGATAPRDSWPARLETSLQGLGTGGETIEVINAGLNYALSSELLIHFILLGSKLDPDIVIWEGPGNDWLPAASGDYSDDYRVTRSPGSYPQPRFGERAVIRHSYIARLLLAMWLRKTPSTGLIALERPGVDWDDPKTAQAIRSSSFEPFRSNLETLADLCTARRIPLVLVPFIIGSVESQVGHRSREFFEAQASAIRRLNQIMEDVAAGYGSGVTFLGSAPSLPDDLFVDGVHLNPEGEDLKAGWISQAVTQLLS